MSHGHISAGQIPHVISLYAFFLVTGTDDFYQCNKLSFKVHFDSGKTAAENTKLFNVTFYRNKYAASIDATYHSALLLIWAGLQFLYLDTQNSVIQRLNFSFKGTCWRKMEIWTSAWPRIGQTQPNMYEICYTGLFILVCSLQEVWPFFYFKSTG